MNTPSKCRTCGSSDLIWFTLRNTRGAQGEPLRMPEIAYDFILGCKECSETLRVLRAEDVAEYLTLLAQAGTVWQRAQSAEVPDAQAGEPPAPYGWVAVGQLFTSREDAADAAGKTPCVEVYSRSQVLAILARSAERQALAEELTRQNSELKSIDERTAELETELAAARETLNARIQAAQASLDKLEDQRHEAGQAVPKPILQRYEFIRSRLKNPVIVPVEAGICSGCHIAIPPQSFIELQKGIQILSCPNCQRLIYWSDHIKREDVPDEAAETPYA